MYRITLVLFAIMATSAYGGSIMPRQVLELDGRIVGGEYTTIERHPHQVSVRLWGFHTCGGSIISSRVILTAAHCIHSTSAFKSYSVEYGSTSVGSNINVLTAERLVRHPRYNSTTLNNDAALIILASEIKFSASVQPISVATESPAPGTLAVASGWGKTSEGGSSSVILQQVGLNINDNNDCKLKYEGINDITDSMVCASVPNGGKNACEGDSGGPLVANGQLVGITSWGVGCARPEYPGVFSNVANLKDFIDSVIN